MVGNYIMLDGRRYELREVPDEPKPTGKVFIVTGQGAVCDVPAVGAKIAKRRKFLGVYDNREDAELQAEYVRALMTAKSYEPSPFETYFCFQEGGEVVMLVHNLTDSDPLAKFRSILCFRTSEDAKNFADLTRRHSMMLRRNAAANRTLD
ncbi:MAG: hypothetical protein WC455_10240 [Dehalococcoidia bacterium]